MKLIFLFVMFCPIISVPAFFLFADWGRWITMLVTVQFMFLFYFLHDRVNTVVFTASKFAAVARKNIFALVLFFMLSVFFGPILYLPASQNFMRLFNTLVGVIRKIGGI